MKLFYREIAPSLDTSHLVLSFWEFAVDGETRESMTHEIFPDGCISLIYHRNKNLDINTVFIHGLSIEALKAPVSAGDVFWGMRFSPAAGANILRSNPYEVQLKVLNDSKKFAHLTEGLLEKLTDCQSFDKAIEIYETKLKTLHIHRGETDEKVAEAIGIIEESGGEIKISELAEMVGLSTRQLERRFRKSAGLTPKQFARVRRIRATAINLIEETEVNWANRAAEMGFSDQAHLTHEFSTITGRSPNSFAKNVKRIEHGKIIK